MPDNDLRIVGFEVSNLRGYRNARLTLRDLLLLVGDNNQGKSSILSLANWLINDTEDELLLGHREMTPLERAFLVPANRTAGRGRRFTISIVFTDGRRGRRFGQSVRTPALLRLSVLSSASRVRLNVGVARRGESGTEPKAMDLLKILRKRCSFLLIPPVRDASPDRMSGLLGARLDQVLLHKFSHHEQGGAPREYRFANTTVEKIDKMLANAGAAIWTDLRERLPGPLARSMRIGLEANAADLADWVRDRTVLSLSTGLHDSEHVAPLEVGTGLQSTVDLALRLAHLEDQPQKSHVIAAVEEPEAFLHPAAQRDSARMLRKLSSQSETSVIVATHSPYILDEAEYGEVTLVRGHQFYEPLDDQHRGEINTALMCAQAAEALFAEGVLLVEGPGDAELFRTLLRRLRAGTSRPELSRLSVLPVGGKSSFAPWYRLFSSYGRGTDRPIRFLCLVDGDAATKKDGERAILRLLTDVGVRPSESDKKSVIGFGDEDWAKTSARLTAVRAINRFLEPHHIRLFSVDLEWAAFGGAASTAPESVAEILECDIPKTDVELQLARRAGSKVSTGKVSSGARKQPYRRAKLAQEMSMDGLPPEIRDAMRTWLGLAIRDQGDVKRLIP